MGSKGHLACSIGKSVIRIGGAAYAVLKNDWKFGFFAFGVAEVLGVFEELLDKR